MQILHKTGNLFNSSVYATALNRSTGKLMYSAAKHAKGLVADAQNERTYESAACYSDGNIVYV